jgi:tape measure domain-containing protein
VAVSVVDIQVNSQSAVRNLQQVGAASKAAQAGVNGLKNAVTGLLGAFTAVTAAKFVFAKTAELESQTRSLQVLTGSAQQAKQIIQELQQLGAVTPFTSTELIDAAKRLQAFGVQANNVVETTRRLADASGATGAELQGLVTAYGQVQAKGRLQGEELLQFQERGIALQEELRKMYGMTGEEFQKALSKGQISAKAVEVALQRLTSTGGKYANGAIAQSDTLNGKLSTLQDGVDALARRIGTALTPALKAIFNQAIAVVDAINAALSAGRGGGFTRSVAGARQFLNIGATSQAVDNIAKGVGQVGSQKNRTGINQNLQALQQYQRLLQSVGPNDPNANRAVQLQGTILQKINQNLAAQKQLQAGAKQTDKLFTAPPLGAGTGGGAKGGGGKSADKQAKEIKDITAQELELRLRLGIAQRTQNEQQEAYYNKQLAILQASQQEMGPNERKAAIFEAVVQYAERLRTIEDQRNKETLPEYITKLTTAASGYASVLEYSKQLTEQQKQQQALADGISNTVGQGMTSAFNALIQGSQDFGSSLRQIASGVLIDIANQLLQVFVIQKAINAISGLFGGGRGGFASGASFNPGAFGMASIVPGLSGVGNFFGGARANGGSVMGGKGYLVGERGPELFMPGRSGGIAPTGSFGGGVNVVVNVDASGSQVQGDQNQARALGGAISAAVQAEIVKQQRPGGLLAGTR